MAYPTVKDATGSTRSIKTKSSSAAGSNADPDIPLVYLDSGENFAGQVGAAGDLLSFTPVLDTSIYAAGDVLFVTTALASAFRVSGGRAKLTSLVVLDKDDQGCAFDLVFLRANSSLGTINTAPDIDDTEAQDVIGIISIATGDYIDLGANRVATLLEPRCGLILEPTTGTSLYLAGITRGGTPTYTASGMILQLGLEWY